MNDVQGRANARMVLQEDGCFRIAYHFDEKKLDILLLDVDTSELTGSGFKQEIFGLLEVSERRQSQSYVNACCQHLPFFVVFGVDGESSTSLGPSADVQYRSLIFCHFVLPNPTQVLEGAFVGQTRHLLAQVATCFCKVRPKDYTAVIVRFTNIIFQGVLLPLFTASCILRSFLYSPAGANMGQIYLHRNLPNGKITTVEVMALPKNVYMRRGLEVKINVEKSKV